MDTKEYRKLSDLHSWDKNPRTISTENFDRLKKQIQKLGQYKPLLITKDGTVLGGNMRLKAYNDLHVDNIWVSVVEADTEEKKIEYALSDNDRAGQYEGRQLKDLITDFPTVEWNDYSVDLNPPALVSDIMDQYEEVEEDEAPEVAGGAPISKLGEVYTLGRNRLMCGDSTKIEDVEKLMDGQKADMVLTDPPYGMKKENEGVLNDNLNYDDLLAFNREWIPLTILHLKENGNWYCWGTDEPLMDIYSEIIKPYIKTQQATFRNLITWDKGDGQGQLAEEFRMYPIADEKCLFIMMGVQGFNTNADNYCEAWEPIRTYLEEEKKKMGWSDKWIAEKLGIDPRLHWFSKSQWELPTEEKYIALRELSEYDAFKKEYDEIKKEHDEIKKEYYSTRAYFDNLHDNMNNVWHFKRAGNNEKQDNGGHATPKPIELCSRAIKSSSRKNEIVMDVFGGSGSTLIACEQTDRTCYMMELDPKYCDVIRKRYWKFIHNNIEEGWEVGTLAI